MKKNNIIICIHSFVDVITNSSTELFVCDTDKSVDVVRSLINEIQDKHPNEYGHRLYVDQLDSDDYMIGEICDFYGNDESAVKYLELKGYKIEKPTEPAKSRYIKIYAERGGLHPIVESFITSTFNVIHYTSEA